MRTTLALDDDVLAAARAIAQREGRSLGEVVSGLVRAALVPRPDVVADEAGVQGARRGGLTLLPTREAGRPVTMEWVNQLRDEV